MATFVPLVHGAQAEIGFSLGGKNIENRLWFLFDNPPIGATDLQGLADGLALWHLNKVLPLLSNDLELLSVIATKWDDHVGDIFEQTHVNTFGGTTSKSYSANVAVRVNLRWPLNKRERLNCNFVPGIPDSGVQLNTLDATFRDALWEAYADLIDAARLFSPILNWRWVVTSQIDGGSFRSEQVFGECIGPVASERLKLGQRRGRLL